MPIAKRGSRRLKKYHNSSRQPSSIALFPPFSSLIKKVVTGRGRETDFEMMYWYAIAIVYLGLVELCKASTGGLCWRKMRSVTLRCAALFEGGGGESFACDRWTDGMAFARAQIEAVRALRKAASA